MAEVGGIAVQDSGDGLVVIPWDDVAAGRARVADGCGILCKVRILVQVIKDMVEALVEARDKLGLNRHSVDEIIFWGRPGHGVDVRYRRQPVKDGPGIADLHVHLFGYLAMLGAHVPQHGIEILGRSEVAHALDVAQGFIEGREGLLAVCGCLPGNVLQVPGQSELLLLKLGHDDACDGLIGQDGGPLAPVTVRGLDGTSRCVH